MKQKLIEIEGIVSQRDQNPYVVLFLKEEGKEPQRISQLSMSEARSIAQDILIMCSRAEADAMIWKFFSENFAQDLPEHTFNMVTHMMTAFRKFRLKLDSDFAIKSQSEPILDQINPTKRKQ